ncbi:hypothetical protein N825_30855 [Skermanella stibiiresistens SB22]|uniref:NERD domain-containing protein n=1 Tax=Skermanella stibiiresistens SB22 TaxID=1385369 RepID=W9H926_9PROT|nr:hypothetical protein [Skermanella stibiiresistens]EWY41231.1 hypothetical protein N825_30855 [Skermanella stibiiresistens SB22]
MHATGLSQLLVYGAFIVMGVAILYAFRAPPPPKIKGERITLRSTLDNCNHPCLHDVRIVDKQGRIVCIEHIMRLPASVVLIGTVAASAVGEVTGMESIPKWKITRRGSSTTFVNPLLELQPLNLAFKRRFPLLRVRGLIVFPDTITFPEGTPKGAVRACDFERWLDDVMRMDGTVSSATEQAWPAITAMVASAHARLEQARARGLLGGASAGDGSSAKGGAKNKHGKAHAAAAPRPSPRIAAARGR